MSDKKPGSGKFKSDKLKRNYGVQIPPDVCEKSDVRMVSTGGKNSVGDLRGKRIAQGFQPIEKGNGVHFDEAIGMVPYIRPIKEKERSDEAKRRYQADRDAEVQAAVDSGVAKTLNDAFKDNESAQNFLDLQQQATPGQVTEQLREEVKKMSTRKSFWVEGLDEIDWSN